MVLGIQSDRQGKCPSRSHIVVNVTEPKPSLQPLFGTQCLARRVLFKARQHSPKEPAGLFLSRSLSVVLFPVGGSSFQAFRTVSGTSAPDRIDENIDPPLF